MDLAAGTGELHAENICVFDAFTVPNSLSPTRALGFARGRIDSIDLKLSGVVKSFIGVHDTTNKFSGDFFQIGTVTIAVTATTPKSTGHGFQFISDPASTVVNFAQIGHESNGVFFS